MKTVIYTHSYEQDDCSLTGNVMASGDDAADRAAENEIAERLNRGDDSAWCCVKVVASLGDFRGSACLGSCTLGDGYTLEQCIEDHGLEHEALEDLRRELALAVQAGEQAAALLQELGE